MIRKKIMAGNWKMNKTASEGAALVAEISAAVGKETSIDIVLCPPFTALESAGRALEGTALKLGAQNLHPEKGGAFTGECSAEMLRSLFVSHVIVGHSERRAYFAESDDFINRKVLTSLANQLKPIFCVGETLAERDAGRTFEVVQGQLAGGLKSVAADLITTVIIAYEPVWAVGTGKVATTSQAQEVHAFLRANLAKVYGDQRAQKVRILYGGSMKPANAADLLAQPDVDGGLIGGAALESRSFIELVNAAVAAS